MGAVGVPVVDGGGSGVGVPVVDGGGGGGGGGVGVPVVGGGVGGVVTNVVGDVCPVVSAVVLRHGVPVVAK